MEDLVSMCERRCRKACNLRSAAEDSEETCHSGSSGGRARRYRKRGSPKPAAGDAGAMDTDPSPVRLWDSEGHSEGYRTAYEQPLESEETARPPTRANTAPEPSLEHDAEALERPARARTAPVARHTEPTRDRAVVAVVPLGGAIGVCHHCYPGRHAWWQVRPSHYLLVHQCRAVGSAVRCSAGERGGGGWGAGCGVSPARGGGGGHPLVKPVRTPVAIFGSLGVCIYVPASRHWLISYSPILLT